MATAALALGVRSIGIISGHVISTASIVQESFVAEDAEVGTPVCILAVTGAVGTPVFTLVDDAGGRFALDGNTLEVAGALDYETNTEHTVIVSVSGTTPPIADTSLTIHVIDVGEAGITLTGSTIVESAGIGDAVGTLGIIMATGTPVFTLVDSSDGRFAIDGTTLEVAGVLDFETVPTRSITVSVTGTDPVLPNATFNISITNVEPTVVSYNPVDGEDEFPYNDDLIATFGSAITLGTGTIYLRQTSDSALVDSWDVVADTGGGPGNVQVVSSTQLTMHLSNALTDGVEYSVTWDAGVVTAGGEAVSALSSATAWNFTAAVPAGYDIFLTTGDSNLMTGAGLDPAIDVVDADVKQLGYTAPYTNLPIAAIEPLDYASQGYAVSDGFIGHDQHFSVDYYKRLGHLQSPRQVLLVVDGIGGSYVGAGGWGANTGSVGNPTSSGSELTLATTRLATALALTGTNEVKGVLDHEIVNNYLAYGNVTGHIAINGYRVNKYREVQYLRNLVGPTVPIVVCRAAKPCINADLGAPYGTNGVAIDRVLQSVPKNFPYTAVANSQVPTELLASGDGVHFTAPEQRILAERYYTAWLAAQSNTGRVVVWDPDCLKTVDGFAYGLNITNNGLDITNEGSSAWKIARTTGPLRSGKAYCELKIQAFAGYMIVGFCNGDCPQIPQLGGATGHNAGIDPTIGNNVVGYTKIYSGAMPAWSVNDIAMLAVDMSLGKAWVGKNGTWLSGNPAAGTGEWISGIIDPIHVAMSLYDGVGTAVWRLQAKTSSFTHTPPTGFGAWHEDVATPSVLTYFPADNSTDVINALGKIYARFNTALTFGTSGTISLKKTSDNSVVQTWNVATDQGYTAGKVGIINEYLLVMYLSASLGQGIQYYVVYDAGVVKNIEDETNAALVSSTVWSFTSIDLPTPVAVTYSPPDNVTAISVHNPLVVTFNTPIVAGTGTITLKKTSDNSTVKAWNIVTDAGDLAGQCKISGSELRLYPAVALAANTEHYVVWDAGVVTNVALEPVAVLSVTTTWSFTTEATASLLLDTFTYGGIWSVRKLVTAYAGNCVRIRRSSDNAEQNFGFVSNLLDTAGIATFIGGGTGHLVTWYDQGGNGINPTTAVSAGQALYVAAGPGSKPTFRFPNVTGTEFYRIGGISRANFMNADEVTFFLAFKEDSALGTAVPIRFWHTIDTEELYIKATFNDNLGMIFGNSTTGNVSKTRPTSWDDLWHVTEMYRLPSSGSNEQGVYVDGVLHKKEFDKVGSFPTLTGVDFTSHSWRGDCSEMFTVKTGLDYGDRTIIRHNMMTAFAVALPLVLDGHSVGAAYGLRRLRTNWTGNCIRIRRSSDSTEQDFGFVGDVVDTAGIATFVGGGSGFVVTWYDQSGSTLDITNATPANQPLYVASGIGSKPTIRFDGTNDGLAKASVALTSLSGAAANTIIAVVKQDGTQANNDLFYWTSTNFLLGRTTIANNLEYTFGVVPAGQSLIAQPTGWDDTPHIVEMYRTGAALKGLVTDGTQLDGTSASGAAASGTGTWNVGFGSGNFLKGDLSELFTIKTFVDTIPRVAIRTNLASYYGITVA